MGKVYDAIDERLGAWLAEQRMFFVATAPSGDDGHVNVSPKGLDGFRVLGPRAVAYLDLTGSGIETIAHVKQNGRIVLMFCAFEGPPKIVRLHGRASVCMPGTTAFAALRPSFPEDVAGVRAILHIDVTRISDSCGYGVPRYDYVGERTQLVASHERKSAAELAAYRTARNAVSVDGLPGWVEPDGGIDAGRDQRVGD